MHNFLDFQNEEPGIAWLGSDSFNDVKGQEIPTTRVESWKYTSLRPIQTRLFKLQSSTPRIENKDSLGVVYGLKGASLKVCFLNGKLQSIASLPKEIKIKSFSDLDDNEIARVRQLIDSDVSKDQSHFFESVNRSLCNEGIYVSVDADFHSKEALELLMMHAPESFDGNEDSVLAAFPRVVIDLKQGSKLEIYETSRYIDQGVEANYMVSPSYNCHVGDGAHLALLRTQQEHESSFIFHTLTADVLGKFDLLAIDLGGKISRSNVKVNLQTKGAETRFNGLLLTKEGQEKDHRSVINHQKEDTQSDQLYKTIAGALGKASFAGCIEIDQQAPRSNASQLSRNLMLDDSAEVNSQPQLMINNDDVKCSHGAAYSRPSEEEIFYLLSRGINKETATRMLSMAFADEVLLDFETGTFREECVSQLIDWIHNEFDI